MISLNSTLRAYVCLRVYVCVCVRLTEREMIIIELSYSEQIYDSHIGACVVIVLRLLVVQKLARQCVYMAHMFTMCEFCLLTIVTTLGMISPQWTNSDCFF
jgi:hypothetical protein